MRFFTGPFFGKVGVYVPRKDVCQGMELVSPLTEKKTTFFAFVTVQCVVYVIGLHFLLSSLSHVNLW